MPGVARKKTKVEIDAETARTAAVKAKEAHDKNANVTTKAALDHATQRATELTKQEHRERFVLFGKIRVDSAVAKIKAFGKLSNRRSYEYSAEDITAALGYIRDTMEEVELTFQNALTNPGKATVTQSSFSFPSK